VSFFLEPESFLRALTEIGDICAPHSRLVFDYLDQAVVEGSTIYRGARRAARSVRSRGEPYTLGLTPDSAAEATSAAGFRCVESIRVTDLVRTYGGLRPYCSSDDFMGILTVERRPTGPETWGLP
jgi:O-methyltransferase involved in polyketide biosynthesis